MKIRLLLQWLSKQSTLLITGLLFGIIVVLLWYITTGEPKSIEQVAVGIAAISAFFAAVSAIATLAQAVEIQKQRDAQERPYIITYFDSANNGAMYFVIENKGNSPACNVQFKFKSAPTDFAGRPLDKVSLFSKPITFLPAGKSLRQIVNASFRFFEEGNITSFSFSIEYESISSIYYFEEIEHDLEYLRDVTLPVKTIGEHLGDTSEELKKISRNLEKLINSVITSKLPKQTKRQISRKKR